MSRAFLDTSFLLAIILEEPQATTLRRILVRHDELFASDLFAGEVLSAAARERVAVPAVLAVLRPISVVLPDRTLEDEVRRVLEQGYLRGADLWHVACALFVVGADVSQLSFLSRDKEQRKIAGRLGFRTP